VPLSPGLVDENIMATLENKSVYVYKRKLKTGIRGNISRRLPVSLKRHLRFLMQLSLDGIDLLLNRRKDLVPPRHMNFVGDSDYESTGKEFLDYFVKLGGLRPGDRVLEVGCGIGRMARPLTQYLQGGSYEGIDIVQKGVDWCQRNISSRFSNFHFQLADVHNPAYNPNGRFQPTEYRFPFDDNEFDFVFLTSVFTHMLLSDTKHYLSEIGRVLRPGGKCFITFFLLNNETQRLVAAGRSSLTFRFPRDGYFINDQCVPENAIAFGETDVRSWFVQLGLSIEAVHAGDWCGRDNYLSYQDIVVARNNSNDEPVFNNS
jgi:SAM-dependent methyltransferase